MKADLPKQFITLQGKPVLMRTIDRFVSALKSNVSIVLVLPEDQIDFWKELCAEHDFKTAHQIVVGGKTRFDSVKNGLAACPDDGIVGIHDGVRPLISDELINLCYEETQTHGSALPVTPVSQSLRLRTESGSKAISREGVLAVQTPQCFELHKIKRAYKQPYEHRFTDDATVYEGLGYEIALVEGESTNIKITAPADLKIAEAILASSSYR